MRNVVDLYEPAVVDEPPRGLRARAEEAERFKTGAVFDVIVIGGTPAALYLARLLALHELRCAIMIAGDLPYEKGERLEIPAVRGSLRQRWRELAVVVGLAASAQGAVTISRNNEKLSGRDALSMRILEMLRWIRRRANIPGAGEIHCSWSRSRVIRELLVAARQEGCAVLNYAGFIRTVPAGDEFLVAVENDGMQRIRAGAVVEVLQPDELGRWALAPDRTYRASAVGLVDGILIAEELTKEILSHLPGDSVFHPGRTRRWPGCGGYHAAGIVERLVDAGLQLELAERVVARFGKRVAMIEATPGGLEVAPTGDCLAGERQLTIADELAVSDEDIRRRLDLL